MSQRGSIRKRGETWTAYWFVRDANGVRVQRSKGGFRRKTDAQGHLTTVLGAVQDGTYAEPKKATLAAFTRDEWLPAMRSSKRRASTVASYEMVMEKWVLPRLGGMPLPQLTAGHVQRLYAELRDAGGSTLGRGGLSPRSVQYAATVLGMVLKHATLHGYVARNPMAGLERPGLGQRREMDAWTALEAGAFLDTVAGDRLYCAWLLFLSRGFRRGELAGLRWADVDLEGGRVSVVHTRVLVDGKTATSGPKTAKGRRTVPLDVDLVAALREHRRHQLEERLAWGEGWQDTGYVFTREDGSPVHPEYLSTAFEGHVRRAGLRRIRLHDTRHTCATLALAAGIPTEAVSRWLGHASVSITQDLYQHAIPQLLEEAGAKLTAIIQAGRRAPGAGG